MRKMPTLFTRDFTDPRRPVLTDQINPSCAWVLTDPGVIARRKYDGTAVMLDAHGEWWTRHMVKPGKTTPRGFLLVEHDEQTGNSFGWRPAEDSQFTHQLAEATVDEDDEPLTFPTGTYELIGPQVNSNPEKATRHALIRHSTAEQVCTNAMPHHPAGIKEFVAALCVMLGYEGIVWCHPDGRMAKLKLRDLR